MRAAGVSGGEEPGKRGDDDDRAADEEDARPRGGGVGEDAEGDAGIAAVDEIDEVVDELAVPAFVGLRFEPGFGRAVDDDDGEREPEPAKSSGDDQRFVLLAARGLQGLKPLVHSTVWHAEVVPSDQLYATPTKATSDLRCSTARRTECFL